MRRALPLVAFVLAVRVLGVSLVLPGFPAHGAALGGTAVQVGIAFGAYGLSMALLQVPFGAFSDRVGRRAALVVGLVVAGAGSALAAWAPTVGWLVAARLLQGAGAVNGVALALLAERAPESRRTTALAVAGATIGGAFVAGLAFGAIVPATVPQLFLVQAGLHAVAVVAVLVLADRAPPAERLPRLRDVLAAAARPSVLALGGAGFALNLALHAVLFAFPALAAAAFGESGGRWAFAGAVAVGGGLMFGLVRRADRGALAPVARAAFAGLGAAGALLLAWPIPALVLAAGAAFFAAQATLSAALPSLAQRAAEGGARGAAQGSLQTAQAAGIAAGGAVAGALAGAPLALAGAVAAAGAAGVLLLARRD